MPFKKIISGLLLPLLYLNLAGLAAGAVWLSVTGQWQLIGVGVFALLFSPYVIPIVLIPAGILSHFMGLYQAAQRPRLERLMFILSVGYVLLFLTLWCAGIFAWVTQTGKPETLGARLLWANVAALAPLLMWSSRDRNNIFIVALVETAQLAMIGLIALALSGLAMNFGLSFLIFGGILALMAGLWTLYEEKYMNKHGNLGR